MVQVAVRNQPQHDSEVRVGAAGYAWERRESKGLQRFRLDGFADQSLLREGRECPQKVSFGWNGELVDDGKHEFVFCIGASQV